MTARTHSSRRRRRAAIPILVLLTLAGCSEQPEAEAEPPPPKPIAWTAATRFDAQQTRRLPGVLRAAQRAPLSFEVAGRVTEVAVEIGEAFDRGQVLARLDPRNFELALEERRGQLAEAKAQLAEAEEAFKRQRQLYEQGWAAKAAYDRAKSALDSARSRVETARARLAIAEEDLADTTLTAPYAGTVADRLAEPSQRLQAGETVLKVQGGDALEAVVAAPETVVDRLEPGSRHAVRLPARPDADLTGTIAEIATDAAARNAYTVTLRLTEAPSGVRSGMTAEVAFQLRPPETPARDRPRVAIPATAFLAVEGETRVAFVVDPDAGVVHRRAIEVAEIAGDRALVSEGLEPGEIVATKGLAFLTDGQRVDRLGVGPRRFER
jgi:RND family efflux transporter MFP subunit